MTVSAIIAVANESIDEIAACLASFRRSYLMEDLAVILDGVEREDVVDMARNVFNAKVVRGDRLKCRAEGGKWWHRFAIQAKALGSSDVVLKLDPDTRIWRRFKTFPESEVFGAIAYAGSPREHVQGGCQGLRRSFIRRLIESRIALDDALTVHANYFPRGAVWDPEGMSTDHSLMWMARRLGAKWEDWPEVSSFGGAALPPANPVTDGVHKYAATHPHKAADAETVLIREAKWTTGLLSAFRPIATNRPPNIVPSQVTAIASEILSKPAGRFLVFGAGFESAFWTQLSRGKATILESDQEWIGRLLVDGIQVQKVSYWAKCGQWMDPVTPPSGIPADWHEVPWTTVIVDGPAGESPAQHGREQSIYVASEVRRLSRAKVFVHDYDRTWERACCDKYLGKPRSVVSSGSRGLGELAIW